ncbi:hypothetical protein [Streptomyces goshikiensis]|uniref:hypothetical protein n=1 Tax=Streptomyces goshikiensis TaxID=1942 RepID=UPI00365FC90F
MADEQCERGALEHLDVDVGVTAREGGQSAGVGEDALGLTRPQIPFARKKANSSTIGR